MAVCDNNEFLKMHKDNGLVRDVFNSETISKLYGGNYAIGHTRYPTAGQNDNSQAQPFYVNSPFGIALVHNGNLVNANKLKEDLENNNKRHINSTSDSEILLNIFADCLSSECMNLSEITHEKIFKAVENLHNKVEGAYAVVLLIIGYGVVSFRDPNGIRPLIYGKKNDNYIVASESVALDCLGYTVEGDVGPGQTVIFANSGKKHVSTYASGVLNPCIFEYVYLSRPDSTIDSVNVYQSRLEMGKFLAKKNTENLNRG